VSPGNLEFVQILTIMVVSPLGVAAVLHVDERRLRGEQLERAWAPATRDATILNTWQFTPLYGFVGIIVHFTKTRWSLAGFGLGVVWATVLYWVSVGAVVAITAAIEWLGL
jgi:hypothetical protein